MKKVVSWIKKISLMVGVFLVSMWNKVWASDMLLQPSMYGSPATEAKKESLEIYQILNLIWEFFRLLILPLIFIIGIIVCLKKGSYTRINKVIIVLLSVVVVSLYCYVCFNLI